MSCCRHTTHTPLPSTPWEAWLEEILRSAQRDYPVPAEGKTLTQCPYQGRASSFSLPGPASWCPEGPGQDLGLRQMLAPLPSEAWLRLVQSFGGFSESVF